MVKGPKNLASHCLSVEIPCAQAESMAKRKQSGIQMLAETITYHTRLSLTSNLPDCVGFQLPHISQQSILKVEVQNICYPRINPKGRNATARTPTSQSA